MNPEGNEWNLLSPSIIKTTLQAKGLIRCRIKFIPMLQAMKFFGCKSCSVSSMEKARDDPRWKGFAKFIRLKEKPHQKKCDPVRLTKIQVNTRPESAGATKNYVGGKNLTQRRSRGPMTWKVMRKRVLSKML